MNYLQRRLTKLEMMDVAVVLLYALVTIVGIGYHEVWCDEAQSWLIARDAPLSEIIFSIKEHQHPPLWYGLLALFARNGFSFITQQIINWIISIAAVSVLVFCAPFKRFLKYSLLMSYLMIYEYAVVSRNYMIVIFLVFLLAALYQHRRTHAMLYGLMNVFLALSHLMMLSFSLVLFGEQLIRLFKEKNDRAGLLVAIILQTSVFVMMGWSLLAFPSTHFQQPPDIQHLILVLSRFVFPKIDAGLMNSSVIAGIIVLAGGIFFLSQRWKYLGMFGISVTLPLYILTFKYPGFPRQFGLLMGILLFFLWIAVESPTIKRGKVQIQIVLALCYLMTLNVTIINYRNEIRYEFSGSRKMADDIKYLRQTGQIRNENIVAAPTSLSVPVLAYLPDQRFWYASTKKFGTYFSFESTEKVNLHINQREAIDRAIDEFSDVNQLLFLFNKPLEEWVYQKFNVTLLAKVDRNIWAIPMEKYYLYQIQEFNNENK